MSRFAELRGRAFWVVLGCLICQMGLGYGYVFGPLAVDILAEFEWTRAMYSAARAPQLFVIALASPLIGVLTVRFGARSVLTGATLLLALGFVAVSQMQAIWQLYAVTLLLGLSVTGLGDITVSQAVSQWVTRNRGLALGIVFTGSNLGGALLTRLGSGIADAWGWREAFLWIGVGGLLVMLPFALFAVREPTRRDALPKLSEEESDARHDDGDMDLRAALRTRSFWILAGSLFVFFFYFLGMLEHLVLFLTDVGMERSVAAGHFSNAIALGIISKVALGALADRIPHRSALLIDYGLLAVSSILLLFLPSPVFLPLFVISYGFSVAARDVVYPLIISDCFGLRYMAQIYGALMIALLPGGALGPIFAALVHDRSGSYEIAFATFAVLNCLAVGALTLVRRELRPERS